VGGHLVAVVVQLLPRPPSHLDTRDPGPALRDRLVALARSRDPDLADPVLRDLAQQPARRLTPDDIDRYLTRIEALRDR